MSKQYLANNRFVRSLLLSPLLGGLIGFLFILAYSVFIYLTTSGASIFLVQAIHLSSVVLIMSIGFSYITFIPVLLILLLTQLNTGFKEGVLWFYMFIIGCLLGCLAGYVMADPNQPHMIFIYSIAAGLCFLFNTSLYSVLNNKVKLKKTPSN